MLKTHAVGIDLGTTYSCIAHLNEHGEPVSITNEEGEISTPSVVLYDRGEEVVGTEALRNAIMNPAHVIQNAKRYLGDPNKHWKIDGQTYTPVDVSASIVRKLLRDAQRHIGPIERAVITVPAQFSDVQRHATIEAGKKAGLKQVDIINEPVAAALCYVLGTEGLWFTELADAQNILVYDLGGGTFDLSLVRYQQNEVRVIASSGDLHLGGIDFNNRLLNHICEQFVREFGEDPRSDLESLQHLSWEVEQCKRSLTVRPRAALLCQHAGKRKTYQVEQDRFEELTLPLVQKTEDLTQKLLQDNNLGWARVDVVLSTGGSSRMPMINKVMQRMSGRTPNKSLSPDQSIAHGATYYAGMLLSNSEFVHSILSSEASQRLAAIKQRSVNARALGVLVRNMDTNRREPHYLIPPNTPLPVEIKETFGTVKDGQKRIRLRIVESGPATQEHDFVMLGMCEVAGLPPDLPADAPVEVTIRYDESARVHASARDVTSGREAKTEIVRAENVIQRPESEIAKSAVSREEAQEEVHLRPVSKEALRGKPGVGMKPLPVPPPVSPLVAELAEPVPPARQPMNRPPAAQGQPANRGKPAQPVPKPPAGVARKTPAPTPVPKAPSIKPVPPAPAQRPAAKPGAVPPAGQSGIGNHFDSNAALRPVDSSEIMELPNAKRPPGERRPLKPQPPQPQTKPKKKVDPGEQEFWELVDE